MGGTALAVMLTLSVGWSARAWALDCHFTRETIAPPADVERTVFVLDCPLPLRSEMVWKALRNFPRLAAAGDRPTGVEYARYLDSEKAKREVAARLDSLPLSPKPDATRLLNLTLGSPLLYEEYFHVNLYFVWGVRRFALDTSRAEEGTYRLTFEQVPGLSSEQIYQGEFDLTGEGNTSRLRYTLTLSTHEKLTGEGLLDLLKRVVMGQMYIDGYRTYMEERVAGIMREALQLSQAEKGRGG